MKIIKRWLALVFAIVALLYAGFTGDYFLFDDRPAITANTALTGLDASSAGAWRDAILSSNAGPTGRPLAMLSLTLDAAWQDTLSAIPFKFTSLLIHLACGVLLLAFLLQLHGAQSAPGLRLGAPVLALAVALWLVAPLHVSTVLYPVQRMAQLAALFVLLGLYLFARWRNRWAQQGASAAELLAAALWLGLVTLAAVLSKENGLLLLWLLPLVEWAVFRGRWAGLERRWLSSLALLALVLPLLLVLAVLLWSPDAILAGYGQREFSFAERLLTQLRILWTYVGWFVLPLPGQLGFLHDTVPVSTGWLSPASTALAAIAWVLVLAAAIRGARSRPWFLFGLLFFLIGHSMESSVLALELVFEHRNYLPSVGLALLLAGALAEIAHRLPAFNARLLLLAYCLPLLLLLGLRTHTWGDELRLAESNARYHPDSPRGQYFLSRAYTKRHEEALARNGRSDLDDLLRARAALQRMATLEPESLVAPAALYLLDARWFPGNPEQAVALDTLQAQAAKPVLSASEVNGLNAVLDHLLRGCEERASRAPGLFEALRVGGTNPLAWDLARYDIARCGLSGLEPQQVLAELEQRYPGNLRVQYLRLAANVESNDVAAMYATVARIQALDKGRRQVSRLRALVAD
jgi:protein O-mannosyl-transferase